MWVLMYFFLLNELEKKIRCEAFLSIVSNELNKFSNKGAPMPDSYDTKIALNSRFSHHNINICH